MRILSTVLRGACACLLGSTLLAHAHAQTPTQPQTQTQTQTQGQTQTSSDALVDPAAASKQAREIAQGDPARWYREDATSQARMRTLQKEIGAALQEARNACKKAPAAERNACMQEARAVYQRDMAQARAQVAGQEQTP
ncbi:hypothetical protein [Massilia alkalitolerans]|uniref:hypothetical protein n=1 Tax=Massilia alkalitolerans TaxID=286638 RepID=UPI0028ABE2E0|nr:hypothetical protein [Massilia alkalitolerans]